MFIIHEQKGLVNKMNGQDMTWKVVTPVESQSSIKLIKYQKDAFGWEIKVYDNDIDAAFEKVKELNQKCLGAFPSAE